MPNVPTRFLNRAGLGDRKAWSNQQYWGFQSWQSTSAHCVEYFQQEERSIDPIHPEGKEYGQMHSCANIDFVEGNPWVALLNQFFLQTFCSEEVVPVMTSRGHCVLRLGKAKADDIASKTFPNWLSLVIHLASLASSSSPPFCKHVSSAFSSGSGTSYQCDPEPVPCTFCKGLGRMDSRVPSHKVLPT